MKNIGLAIALLAGSHAWALAETTCRIGVKDQALEFGCLPAISSDGATVAVAVVDPDGGRGDANLKVQLVASAGGKNEAITVLTVDEVEKIGQGQLGDALAKTIAPRVAQVNARLAGFAPLSALDVATTRGDRSFKVERAGWRLSVKEDAAALEIRRDGSAGITLKLPSSTATRPSCAGVNRPYVDGLFLEADAAHSRVVVVRVNFNGNDTCSEPPSLWRVVRLGGASAPSATSGVAADPIPADAMIDTEKAAAWNTLGMKRYHAKEWDRAIADFRAAIRSSDDEVRAHYNLACVASITQDRATALEQLRWLAASDLSQAEETLAKARTDPDLAFILGDPEAQKIFGAPRYQAKLICEIPGSQPIPLPDPDWPVVDGVWCRIRVPASSAGRFQGKIRILWGGRRGTEVAGPVSAKQELRADFTNRFEYGAPFDVIGELSDGGGRSVWQSTVSLKRPVEAAKPITASFKCSIELSRNVACRIVSRDPSLSKDNQGTIQAVWTDDQGVGHVSALQLLSPTATVDGWSFEFTLRSGDDFTACSDLTVVAHLWAEKVSRFTRRLAVKPPCR